MSATQIEGSTHSSPPDPAPARSETLEVTIPFSDVRYINTHIFRVWIGRHVDQDNTLIVEADVENQCFRVCGRYRTIAGIDSLVDAIKEKGWP